MITVYYHKGLQKYTNGVTQHTFEADSYFDIVTASMNLFPKLGKIIKKFVDRKNQHEELIFVVGGKMLDIETLWFPPSTDKKIVLCPVIYGSGKLFRIFLIIIIVVVVVLNPELFFLFSAEGSLIGTTLLGQITSSILSNLVLGLFQQQTPSAALESDTLDASGRRAASIFDGLINRTQGGVIIPLNYGQMRTGGQMVSGFVKVTTHGLPEPEAAPVTVGPAEPSNPREQIVDDFGGD